MEKKIPKGKEIVSETTKYNRISGDSKEVTTVLSHDNDDYKKMDNITSH